jgi:hypothetical protein
MVKLLCAVRGGEDESVTLATKPPVPAKLAFPERTPVAASMVSPFTNRAVLETGAMDQVTAPTAWVT